MYNKGCLIDPPSGWLYGFPKQLDRDLVTGRELREWVVKNGYPRSVMDSYCNCFPIRVIDNPDNPDVPDVASLQATIDSQSVEINELIEERNQVRREYCFAISLADKSNPRITPADVANRRGWACFKDIK